VCGRERGRGTDKMRVFVRRSNSHRCMFDLPCQDCDVLQCVVTCCSVAVCCSVVYCFLVGYVACRVVFWSVAVCCSVSQCVVHPKAVFGVRQREYERVVVCVRDNVNEGERLRI